MNVRVAAASVLLACGSADPPSRTDLPRAPTNHRAERPACTAERTSPEPVLSSSVRSLGCTKNADCTTKRSGRCVVSGTTASCVYDACVTAADCPGVAVCECGAVNICVPEGCLADGDCGHGGYCSSSACEAADGVPHFCHTTDDQCIDDADCGPAHRCRYQASSRTWRCDTIACP